MTEEGGCDTVPVTHALITCAQILAPGDIITTSSQHWFLQCFQHFISQVGGSGDAAAISVEGRGRLASG